MKGDQNKQGGGPKKLRGAPNELWWATNKLRGVPNKLREAPNKLRMAPNKLWWAANKLRGQPVDKYTYDSNSQEFISPWPNIILMYVSKTFTLQQVRVLYYLDIYISAPPNFSANFSQETHQKYFTLARHYVIPEYFQYFTILEEYTVYSIKYTVHYIYCILLKYIC